MGDLVSGLAVGVAYGLAAAAIAVASRATRVLHLAIGPAVVVAALVHLVLVAEGRTPTLVALLLAMTIGALASASIEPLVLRRLPGEASRVVGTFVLGGVLAALGARTLGARTVRPEPLISLGSSVGVDGDLAAAIDVLAIGLPLAVALAWLLTRTTWGARVRIVGGSPAAAGQIGVAPSRVRAAALALAGAVGTVAVLAAAPITLLGLPQAAGLTLRAVAAAFVARDRPLSALAVGVGFGVSEAAMQSAVPGLGADAAVALVVLVMLLWRGGDEARAWGRAW